MANKMLIDAAHPEETRVVVVRGNRIEEFDFESEHKKQLKGNIYLAKVTRVEPSLQAAFIEYGGNRHGFLAFSEIHPDYYQIPVADRQALIEEELANAAADDEDVEEKKPAKPRSRSRKPRAAAKAADAAEGESVSEAVGDQANDEAGGDAETAVAGEAAATEETGSDTSEASHSVEEPQSDDETSANDVVADEKVAKKARQRSRRGEDTESSDDEADQVDDLGSEDAMEEVPVRGRATRKQYKIQEVIKRRQILLVQVVKEERGNKGAALTTYLSLAGRYSVLMPNTARGGGISRKITNVTDRKRLKEVVRDLEVPRGMGIILRTAGANRTKAEVKRDYEYLMRLWETVRTLTLSSTAPALVYEEGSLIKRSIRDLYNKDIDQILVAGEGGYREAKDFMRMLMPSQAKVVQPYRESTPIFARQGIEAQLDKLLQPSVTLKSGGYIIINQTEALVAIDVNSGRSTREHSVEDTAYQTNLEAAEEVARQLRLRDLAGLIVIDFIDMEEKRNNRNVEKKLKDCLKDDRARIQVGRISHFGLMEMSRQRIRASVLESTMQTCPVCGGAGHIRSSSSLALHLLRTVEEHLQKHSTHDIIVKVATSTALYVLNEKRSTIDDLERHHGVRIFIEADESRGHQGIAIEQGAEALQRPMPAPVQPVSVEAPEILEVGDVEAETVPAVAAEDTEASNENSDEPRRRRRRRRGRRSDDTSQKNSAEFNESFDADDKVARDQNEDDKSSGEAFGSGDDADTDSDPDGSRERRRRRRGRRGGRRNRDDDTGNETSDVSSEGDSSEAVAVADSVAVDTDDSDAASVAPSQLGVTDRSFEPEMTDAVDAIDGVDEDQPASLGSGHLVDVPDENEVMADAAEAGASIDGNPPLDAVFVDEEPQQDAPADTGLEEVKSEEDTTTLVVRGPRLISNGEASDEAAEETRPKRTGWWAKRSTV